MVKAFTREWSRRKQRKNRLTRRVNPSKKVTLTDINGFAWGPLRGAQRALLIATAVLLVFPARGMELLGLLLAGGTLVWMRAQRTAP